MSECTKWKMRDICKATYFIELDNNEGCISIFAKTPKKARETAHLIAAAPALLEACEGLMEKADNGSADFDDPEPGGIYLRALAAIAAAKKD